VKVNQAGVVPVIFASSLLSIPQLAASLFGNQNSPQGWVAWMDRYLVPDVHVLPVYYHYEGFLRRSAGSAGKVTGTSEAPAALTVS
jgi:preprotein translocase subunit SecY